MASDYYAVLGVPRDATIQEIRRAYYRLAKVWHPDVNHTREAKARFQEISEAYRMLSEPGTGQAAPSADAWTVNRRRDYYRYGTSARAAGWNAGHATKSPPEEVGKSPMLDHLLFATLLFLGVSAIAYGLIDLFFRSPDETLNPGGLILGLVFTALLLYGWRVIHRDGKGKGR